MSLRDAFHVFIYIMNVYGEKFINLHISISLTSLKKLACIAPLSLVLCPVLVLFQLKSLIYSAA